MQVRLPITAAVFSLAAILLSGCIAYDAASAVVGVGTTAVGAAGSVAGNVVSAGGDIVTLPFDGADKKKAR